MNDGDARFEPEHAPKLRSLCLLVLGAAVAAAALGAWVGAKAKRDQMSRHDVRALENRVLSIVDQIQRPDEPERDEDAYAPYSHPEKVFMMIWFLHGEVQNGGFHQWISNPTGMYVRETRDALREIGATNVAAMVDQAMALFPDGCPARQQTDRWRQLDALTEAETNFLHDLSRPYGDECGDLLAALLKYWEEHGNSVDGT